MEACDTKHSFLMGVAISLASVAIFGVGALFVYLLFRKDKDKESDSILQAPFYLPPRLEPVMTQPLPPYIPPITAPTQQPITKTPSTVWKRAVGQGSTTRSFTLPMTGSTTEAVRIATASVVPLKVCVRTIAPAGAYSVVSFAASELNIDSAAVPTGDTAIISVGDKQEFRLSPNQALFAKGSISGTVISVVTSNE